MRTVQPRYIQLRAVKGQQSLGSRGVTPAKDKSKASKSLQQEATAAATASSSHSRLEDRHFMDAINRLPSSQCKVRC